MPLEVAEDLLAERVRDLRVDAGVLDVPVTEVGRSRSDFFQNSGAPDSRVATKRVPSRTPLAPRASAATSPRPSTIPTDATTGMETASMTWRTSAIVPTQTASSERGFTQAERCPPASLPWATTMFTPLAATVRASAAVVTIAMTLIPSAWHSRVIARPGSPSPMDQTAGRSSRITRKAPSITSGTRLDARASPAGRAAHGTR